MKRHRPGMTARARVYLTIAATRNIAIAALCIAFPQALHRSGSVYPLIAAMPLWTWGALFAGAGLACSYGAILRTPWVARTGLMFSASSAAMVAVALAYALAVTLQHARQDVPTGLFVWAVVWAALACKDFTVCADPLRSPFEEWAEELIEGDERKGGDGRSDAA